MNIAMQIKKLGLRGVYSYLDKDPEKNMPKLMDWVDQFVAEDVLTVQRKLFRQIIEEKNSNWYTLLCSLWEDIDGDVRKALFENLVINANALAAPEARSWGEKYQCNIPWAIGVNLDQEPAGGLSFDEIDTLMEQAKELGTFMFLLHGKEPLQRKEEIVALCNKHMDCQFMCFTDGTGIDEEFVEDILRVKTFIPAIRMNKAEDLPRAQQAMKLLREAKLPFGGCCSYDKENADFFAREAFYDGLIDAGAKFCWLLSALPEEEDVAYLAMKNYRKTKPLLSIHFCKDEEITGGCLAGRYYCSIEPDAMMKPCRFLPGSGCSFREYSLLEIYQREPFREYYGKKNACRGEFRSAGSSSFGK